MIQGTFLTCPLQVNGNEKIYSIGPVSAEEQKIIDAYLPEP